MMTLVLASLISYAEVKARDGYRPVAPGPIGYSVDDLGQVFIGTGYRNAEGIMPMTFAAELSDRQSAECWAFNECLALAVRPSDAHSDDVSVLRRGG